jgi:hypothetical protein
MKHLYQRGAWHLLDLIWDGYVALVNWLATDMAVVEKLIWPGLAAHQAVACCLGLPDRCEIFPEDYPE